MVMRQLTCTQTPQHRQAFSMGANAPPTGVDPTPVLELVLNPDFHFPQQPSPAPDLRTTTEDGSHRPRSLQIPGGMASSPRNVHRRAVSTLPTFSFNASNTSGLLDSTTPPPPLTPDEPTHASNAITPRRGHRRGASEFVGGDSRLGLENTISTSPGKPVTLPVPAPASGPPAGRRGHAHRRSAAMSSHDVSNIMQATAEASPRLSSSLPNSPMEHPAHEPARFAFPDPTNVTMGNMSDPFVVDDNTLSDSIARPRVGFADNVEYIPRPLSTISSETDESMSTHRNHSVNTSISSMLSLNTPSPVARQLRPALSTTFEGIAKSTSDRPLESTRRNEREGDWLKDSTRGYTLDRPVSEPCAPSPALSFDLHESPIKGRAHDDGHRKNKSLGQSLGFKRRRSEPMIAARAQEATRLSSISLPGIAPFAMFGEDGMEIDRDMQERPSSRHRLKTWAKGKFTRKGRDARKSQCLDVGESPITRPVTADELSSVPPLFDLQKTAEAETDLDAVFSSQGVEDAQHVGTSSPARIEMLTPSPSHHSSFHSSTPDELSPVLDLDAALGPFKTPPLGSHRFRRELHSSRPGKDLSSFGNYHRRTESAPVLPLFESPMRNAVHPTMADVFEEEEEEEISTPEGKNNNERKLKSKSTSVAEATTEAGDEWGLSKGLRIDTGETAAETEHSEHMVARHSNMADRPTSCLVSEIIPEEPSSTEGIEVVHPEEEPRSSSLTKSSDSSDTATVLAPPCNDSRSHLDPQSALVGIEASSTSSMSSPDWARRQSSFDTSRLGTSASSITDNRTMSSYGPDYRASVEDVPSLTSSRSTMISTRRNFSGEAGLADTNAVVEEDVQTERRRKRASIQSLSQLVGGSFGPRNKGYDGSRPQTAVETPTKNSKRKEHRLKKLLFWKNKTSTTEARSHP